MVKETIPLHVRIRKLLKEEPNSRQGLMNKLNEMKIKITEGRLDGTLKRMKDWEEIKKLDDGRYADVSYTNLEEKIKRAIFERVDSKNNLRKEEIITIAYGVGYPPEDQKFRKLFAKVISEENIHIYELL